MMDEQKMSKKERLLLGNPTELASVVRKQTLIVQNGLAPAGAGDDLTHPLKIYSSFSRFIFTLIDAEKKSVTANLRVTEAAGLFAISRYAEKRHYDALYQQKPLAEDEKELDRSSPAFTRKFSTGKMKGKTPVQVLLEAEDKTKAVEQLNRQWKWLKEQNDNNPDSAYAKGNREQMEAISQAAKLYQSGKLDGVSHTARTDSIVLYPGGFRPLRNRKQQNGKTFVYEMQIEWILGDAYPVRITIRNYYAIVNENQNGTLNVQAATKEAEICNRMSVTASEWQNILYMMQANLSMFEQLNAGYCYNQAAAMQKRSRELAGL